MPFKVLPKYYSVWSDMKQRCNNPNDTSYHHYGGRGIYVCKRWTKSYKAFESDMGDRPENFEIDRINNDGPYSPENCHWVNRKANMRNRRNTTIITVDGVEYIVCDLTEKTRHSWNTIVARAEKGLSYAEIIAPERRFDMSGLALGPAAKQAVKKAETHCKNGHKYTDENTRHTKQGWRVCKDCLKMYKDRRQCQSLNS